MRKTYKGKFQPKYPSKYKGRVDKIVYRSTWELRLLKWCDENPDVVLYSSEEIVVPYVSPIDGEYHRYFVDFWIKMKSGQELLIEVKPEKQTKPPKQPKKLNESYIKELETWNVNQAKWNAAIKYARMKGMTFRVWTEKSLNNIGIKIK